MTHNFDVSVRAAVLHHMNDDHRDDNLLIARAFGPRTDITGATMTGFDGDAGHWTAETPEGAVVAIRIPWLGGPITERPDVRREIVALYDQACDRLRVERRPHA